MSRSFETIVNTDTFGIWKERTNELITAFTETVTLEDTNDGNIIITGQLTSQSTDGIVADKVTPYTVGNNLFTIDSDLRVDGAQSIYSLTSAANGGAGAITNLIDFYLTTDTGDVIEWTVGPSEDHTQFRFESGTDGKLLYIDKASGTIDGAQLTISNNLLAADLGNKDIGGNSATTTKWANPLTLSLSGDASGSVSFAGDEGTKDLAVTIAGGTSDSWTNDITITFGFDANNDPIGDVSGNVTFKGDGDKYVNLTVRNDSHTHDGRYYTESEANTRFVNVTGDTMSGNLSILNTSANPVTGITLTTAGAITATGDITAFGTVSDISKKEKIEKIENGLDKVLKLSGYTFNYIGEEERMTGVIAQEVEEVLPEVIYETESVSGETTKAVRYGNMMGLIIEAIKDLHDEIQELKKQL